MLVLLLSMALLIIAAGIVASSLAFTIRRDREEELIHRGVQYTRAIREFTKRTGRYPMRLEELDQTSGRRFLRKHYKDPITGKDFKLVYLSQLQMSTNPIPQSNSGDRFDNPNDNADPGTDAAAPTDSNASPQPAPPPNPQSGFRGSQSGFSGSQPGFGSSFVMNNQLGGSNNGFGTPAGSFSASSGQPVVGGMIAGVVSASKDQTIREFNRKRHYNEWRFYYDPSLDRAFLINAPTEKSSFQPIMAGSNPNGPQPATPQGQPNSMFGTQPQPPASSFGTPLPQPTQ